MCSDLFPRRPDYLRCMKSRKLLLSSLLVRLDMMPSTSQVLGSLWHGVIGEQTIADAIPDKIDHDAHRLEMKNELERSRKTDSGDEYLDLETIKN
jgi:hypothetical protein